MVGVAWQRVSKEQCVEVYVFAVHPYPLMHKSSGCILFYVGMQTSFPTLLEAKCGAKTDQHISEAEPSVAWGGSTGSCGRHSPAFESQSTPMVSMDHIFAVNINKQKLQLRFYLLLQNLLVSPKENPNTARPHQPFNEAAFKHELEYVTPSTNTTSASTCFHFFWPKVA